MTKPDILIIGSGVAGAAVASKILKKNPNASVLMLEAGSKVKMRDFSLHQHYLITGQLPYQFCEDEPYPTKDSAGENESLGKTMLPMNGSRLMVYGGSTVHWGGWSFRMMREDFKLQSQLKQSIYPLQTNYDVIDWPIDYDELEPFYGQAEQYIGVSGDSSEGLPNRSENYPYPAFPYTLEDGPVIEAMKALNLDYGHMPIARQGVSGSAADHTPCQTTGTCKYCPFGARFVAANRIDDMLHNEDYPNFRVEKNVIVESLIMRDKKTVAGVRYIDRKISASDYTELYARQVIVTAGAIESSKLLLRSTSSDWPQGVGNGNDLVGRHLVTHPFIMFEADLPENPDGLLAEMDFPTLVSRAFDSEIEQGKGKFIIVNPSSSTSTRLAQTMHQGATLQQVQDVVTGKTRIQLHVLLEIFSQRRNRLLNAETRNHLGLQETVIDFEQGPDFDRRLDEIRDEIARIFDKMGAKNTRIKTVSWRADHAACTTRMSDSADTGIVDSNLKVFGVDNLYICSNAAFSSLGAVNPTLTLTSLALRLGEHLNDQPLAVARQDVAVEASEPECA
jgi:choline dehydrogenase-like flavoprotein